ncbi:golgin subfamily A member 6-like protein 22 [Myxocyprinus asiaticus]|uniref:golgin subfamily A member 6-like protein 22 n=1 Tax=Myxocyprinus asiaticus TaxID=70543 RepID=UPI002221318C|nr:golgin subfamily A member 6-like protein 22 [Myxocyprinus asiaticus]
MEETYLLNHPGVKKKILHGGQGPLPHFPKGTKLVFHFQTLLDNFERTAIDDSRKNKHPTEIFVGKMFKMEVWEVLLTSMRIGEVAEFWCDAIHTGLYPIVSKGMRLAAQGKDPLEGQKHMCGMGNVFHYHSTGFPELDEIMRTPQPLIFIMELISRESWMMEKDEKLKAVPSLHLLGNALVKQGRFREAAEKYQEAVILLRTVQSREMPGDEDYINLGRLIIPLVLNYCQCMLELEEYYEVIEHTTELLDKHKDCVKAYYKRAKAYAAVWSEKEARKDFLMVANLDVTLSKLIHRELNLLSERMKEKYWEDKERYWNILEDKQKSESKQEEYEMEKEESKGEYSQSPEEVKKEEERKNPSALEENKHDTKSEESAAEANRRITALTEGKDWQQMLRLIMLLQDEGNFYVKEHLYAEATAKFKEALEYIDYLQTKVEHKGEDWESLEKVSLPLCLNLSQCKLELGEYQEVVELNTKLLKKHKDNLKAVYQRARAHSALCNEDEARRDFTRVLQLDPEFKPFVKQEIKKMGENIREKCVSENKNYWISMQEKWEKAQAKRGKIMEKKGVKWADESKMLTVSKDEGQWGRSGSSGKTEVNSSVGTGNKDEKTKSQSTNEESSLNLKEAKADNKTVDKDRDPVQSNVLGDSTEGTQISETDSRAKETQLTNETAMGKEGQDETTNTNGEYLPKPDKNKSTSGEERLAEQRDMTDDGRTEKSKTATELKLKASIEVPTGESSAKPEKSTQKVKRKQRKKK